MSLKRQSARALVFKRRPLIGLVYRQATSTAISLAETLTNWLRERDYKVFTAPEQKHISGTRALKNLREFRKMGLVVVLGGDGSYLRAVRLLDGQPIPILGVNLGSLGFLTPTKSEEVFAAIDATLSSKMLLEPRAMLEVELVLNKKTQAHVKGLNDVVIERGRMSQLINLSIHCDGDLISEVKSDGLIIATPTGSTAYNLSAGGPLVHPAVSGLTITPVSPHSLNSRPLIMPDQDELRFRLVEKPHPLRPRKRAELAQLVVDGQFISDFTPDHEIRVRRCKQDHWMVVDPSRDYFFLLRDKLKFGDRN